MKLRLKRHLRKAAKRVTHLGRKRYCPICESHCSHFDPSGAERPDSRCPFCGAPAWFFVLAEEWNPSDYIFEISEVSKANLEAALQLELSNTSFYLCAMNAAKASGDEYGFAKFKALKKVENEHADAIVKPGLEELRVSRTHSRCGPVMGRVCQPPIQHSCMMPFLIVLVDCRLFLDDAVLDQCTGHQSADPLVALCCWMAVVGEERVVRDS